MSGVGLSSLLGLSALLVLMMTGAIFTNLSRQSVNLFKVTDTVTPPLFLMFFVLSGAELDVTVLGSIGLIGVVYVVARVFGKVIGSYLGARIARVEPVIRNYLGFTLVPQAGVAIGLSLVALRILPEYGATIRAVILCATLIWVSGPDHKIGVKAGVRSEQRRFEPQGNAYASCFPSLWRLRQIRNLPRKVKKDPYHNDQEEQWHQMAGFRTDFRKVPAAYPSAPPGGKDSCFREESSTRKPAPRTTSGSRSISGDF